MDGRKKAQLLAYGKVAVGSAKMVSGVATAFGKGIIGSYLKSHNLNRAAVQLAKHSIESGQKLISEGMKDLRECNQGSDGAPR